MTAKQKELYNTIIALPEELINKVTDYIEYLKFSMSESQAPYEVVAKDEDDLVCKLEKGIQASESGDVYSVDEVFEDIENQIG